MSLFNDTSLMHKLTRVFAGPIADRRREGVHKLRRKFYDKYKFQQAPWNRTDYSFKKSDYQTYKVLNLQQLSERGRNQRYTEFDQMEYMPEIGKALDIYAAEMVPWSDVSPILEVISSSNHIKRVLEVLYYDILNAEHNFYGWARQMCKYGDLFLALMFDESGGISNCVGIPQGDVKRYEGMDENNPNYTKFRWDSKGMDFEVWQMAHFRIFGNERLAPYGISLLETSRRIWRQLTLLEDAMISYRVVRSPERRVFYIDVQGINPKDVNGYIEKVKTEMKRNQIVDEDTGDAHMRYNALSTDEDFFVPVRGSSSQTKIDTLPGGKYVGDVDDVKYLRNKLFTALGVPQAYLADDQIQERQDSLAQKDIVFAKMIKRLQLAFVSELERVGQIHLMSLGFPQQDLVNFKLKLNSPSNILDMQELEQWRMKLDLAAAAEKYLSRHMIFTKFFGMSEEEFEENKAGLVTDAKFAMKLAKLSGEADDGLGADGMGAEGMGSDDEMFGGAFDEPAGEGEDLPGEEETLLSAPMIDVEGRATKKPHRSPNANDDYAPVLQDRRATSGPRRQMKSNVRPQITKNLPKNLYKGSSVRRNLFEGDTRMMIDKGAIQQIISEFYSEGEENE